MQGRISVYCARPEFDSPEATFSGLELPGDEFKVSGTIAVERGPGTSVWILVAVGAHGWPEPPWANLVADIRGASEALQARTEYSLVAVVPTSVEIRKDGATVRASRNLIVTAGQGFRFVNDGLVDPGFGVGAVLNGVGSSDLQQVDQARSGRVPKTTSERLHARGTVFDFNIDDDLAALKRVAGWASFGGKSVSVVGARSLNAAINYDWPGIVSACEDMLVAYQSPHLRPPEFAELQRVFEIREGDQTRALFSRLFDNVRGGKGHWSLSPRQLQDEAAYFLFRFKRHGEGQFEEVPVDDAQTYPLARMVEACGTLESFLGAQLASAVPDSGNPKGRKLIGTPRLVESILAQFEDGKDVFVLSEGVWFSASALLHERLNQRVASIQRDDDLGLPRFDRTLDFIDRSDRRVYSENAYNARVSGPDSPYACLDKAELRARAGRSVIETCDLFGRGRFICVKRAHDAQLVAALAKQIVDAAVCLENYPHIWDSIQAASTEAGSYDLANGRSELTFVACLILEKDIASLTDLTLKAKLALLACKRDVTARGFGFKYSVVLEELAAGGGA